ncbi:alpha/beta hydrolase [Gordonia sp. TBRC 11910]|uniref:Alpha/beta hydrolase n=1 Tax=Gordonia asplenii TaxID=2725283 RepID=A0A848L9U3_9ACTN|nr:alpha/beta hydrolase [Gordonia asplenii]NMO04348.1 alpha/beta hydrolase [Gordonia asplenii]
MAIHPDARALLDGLAAGGVPPFECMTVPQAREVANAFKDLQGPTEEVSSVTDTSAPGPAGDVPVRIYRPAGAGPEPLPAVVYYHGGGWVIGTLDIVDNPMRRLANALGSVIVSVDYRLAPEHPFPAAFDDSLAALQWVSTNADYLNVDAGAIAVAGDSAGGNLAAAVALAVRGPDTPNITAQLLFYPCVEFDFNTDSYRENAEGYLLQRASMQWFYAHYFGNQGEPPTDPRACPGSAEDLSGSAPAFIAVAEYDPLRNDGERYAKRLGEAGTHTELIQYDGLLHGFFWTLGATPSGASILDDAAEFLRSAIN